MKRAPLSHNGNKKKKRKRTGQNNDEEPSLIWDILQGPLMTALSAISLGGLVALASTCKTLYHKYPWRQHATVLYGQYFTPDTFRPFAPYVTDFRYLMPCHHDHTFVDLGACPCLVKLTLYSNGCGTDTIKPGDLQLPSTLTRLTLHNYHLAYLHSNVLLSVPFGQLRITECSGSRQWLEELEPGLTFQHFIHKYCTCFPSS
jgi:hypothetical protein